MTPHHDPPTEVAGMSENLISYLRDYLESPTVIIDASDRMALGNLLARQIEPGRDFTGSPLRVSALGKCARALAYGLNQTEKDGRSIDARARVVFSMGDIVEALIATSLREALKGSGWEVTNILQDQETVSLKVSLGEVTMALPGHPDGSLRRVVPVSGSESMGWRSQLAGVLEVKSMSSYAFTRCQTEAAGPTGEPWGPEEGYWWQVQGYMAATGAPRAYIIAVCKDSGAMDGWWMDASPGHFIEGLKAHLTRLGGPAEGVPRILPGGLVLAPQVNLHKTRGTPNKSHGSLPWQCRYCPYFRPCWSPHGLTESVGRDWRGRPSTTLKVKDWPGDEE